jgi:hypothetical protein
MSKRIITFIMKLSVTLSELFYGQYYKEFCFLKQIYKGFILSVPIHCSSSRGKRYRNSYSVTGFVVTVFPAVNKIFLIQGV